jgi:hypothetical protein
VTRKATHSQLRILGGGLLAALVLLAVWVPTHRATPPLPTADLYTHLSVARHLDRGEGFRTDIAYPLSFAFPFARQLPQPLIHRGPGYPLLMVPVYRAAGRDPGRTVAAVRGLQVGLLGLIAFTGAAALLRRGRLVSLAPWLVLLGASPLLGFAVDWGYEELLCGWLLLVLWLRVREGSPPRPLDGLLAGGLALVRLDLFWLPLLWWLWFGLERRALGGGEAGPPPVRLGRALAVAVAVLVLTQAPWIGRNLKLTGQPFFTLQGQAELVKDTRAWPGYSVYKQLEPQPVSRVLRGDPVPVLRKTARGLKFFVTESPKLAPWPFLVIGVLPVFMLIRGKVTGSPCPFRTGRAEPMTILAEDTPLGPLAAATASLIFLAVQYSFFDHSLRHLLPLVPVFLWEAAPLTGDLAVPTVQRVMPSWPAHAHPARVAAAAALVTGLIVWATWVTPAGWQNARRQAEAGAAKLPARVAAFQARETAVLFVPDAALTWYGDRPAVWDPQSDEVREKIRGYLAR